MLTKFKTITTFAFIIFLTGIYIPAGYSYDKYADDLKVADNLLNQSKVIQAESVYQAILLKNPKYIPAMLALGSLYMRQDKFTEAEKMFLKSISYKPTSDAYERLARNYLVWANTNSDSSEFLLGKAQEAIHTAVNLNKYNDKIYSTQGLIQVAKKEYNEAYDSFNKALSLNPSSQDVYINLGVLYTALDKYSEALQNFERAINIDTNTPRPYKELGKMLLKSGQNRQAIECLKTARFHDVYTTFDDHIMMARLYQKVGSLSDAVKEFSGALAINPNSVDSLTSIAQLWAAMGKQEESIDYYRQAVGKNPAVLTGFVNEGDKYFKANDFDHARIMYTRVLEIDPGNADAFDKLCSLNYYTSSLNKLNREQWFLDNRLLALNLNDYKGNPNLRDISLLKFKIAREGLTNENMSKLIEISHRNADTPEDTVAVGEAFFLLNRYMLANDIFNSAIQKITSQEQNANETGQVASNLISLGDRLYYDNELIASKQAYDKVNEMERNNNAVQGLADVATTTEKVDKLIYEIQRLEKQPGIHQQVIDKLLAASELYPENAQLHYMLSNHYAKIMQYENAINELVKYLDSMQLTPFPDAPTPEEAQELLNKYHSIINKTLMENKKKEGTHLIK